MTEVNPFTNEEIVKISRAKDSLKTIINGTGIFEYHTFNFDDRKISKQKVIESTKSRMVIAGGAISSLLNGEQLNDVDVFILDFDIGLFQLLTHQKNGPWVVKYFLDEDDDPRPDDYKNEHVFATATNHELNIQYILTDHKNRKALLDDFDYLHCTASYYEDKLFINRETYDAITKKMLIPQHKNKKVKSYREQKFRHRGWKNEMDVLIESPSKTLKEILQDKLVNVRGNTPVDAWNVAAKKTNWIDDAVTKTMINAMSKGRDTYSIHGPNITLNDITDELEELLHSK